MTKADAERTDVLKEIRSRHQTCEWESGIRWTHEGAQQTHADRAALLRILDSRAAQPQMPTREQIDHVLQTHAIGGPIFRKQITDSLLSLFPRPSEVLGTKEGM